MKIIIGIILLSIIFASGCNSRNTGSIEAPTNSNKENIIKNVSDKNDLRILIQIEKEYTGAYILLSTNEKGQVVELIWNICHPISEKELSLLIKMKNVKKIHDLYISDVTQLNRFDSKQYDLISFYQFGQSFKDFGPFKDSSKLLWKN